MDSYSPPPGQGLDLVYADETLLVVVKPAGLLSVPGRGADKRDCLASRVQARYPDALIVHRLDMSTSGLLVLARGEAAHRALSRLFAQRQVGKRYVALLTGRMARASGVVDLPLITDWPRRPRQKVDFESGKPSLTRFQLLGHEGESSRVELEPETGRTHQLRVHMQSLGHPILGDELYGRGPTPDAPRLMLHAAALAFAHPEDGRPMTFVSEVPF
ncbi:MAG: RluA family pseudouridine synthase [Rhodocyclaceae bacterium]|nr:RluA family pseudouridine synthase [Rhodocyclaceae bacterium]